MEYLTIFYNLAIAEINLFIMRIVELILICYFISGIMKKISHKKLAVLVIAFAFSMIIIRSIVLLLPYIVQQVASVSSYVLLAIYYVIVLCFIITVSTGSLKKSFYYLLIVFLCVHPLRVTLNHFALQLHDVAYPQGGDPGLFSLAYLAAYTVILYLTFRILKIRLDSSHKKSWKQIIWILMACFPVIYITTMGFLPEFGLYERTYFTVLFAQLCGYSGLALVVGYEYMFALGRKEHDLVNMEVMLKNQHKLHEMRKETADILNQKHHDLKKHLLYLKFAGSEEVKEEYIKSLEHDIEAFEAFHNTGNEAIDIMLTVKGMECAHRKIRVVPQLDGSLLNFLKPLCISTIFGNAMDNAMEALEQVEESKRELNIKLVESEHWLLLSFANPYVTPPKLENEEFLTTKESTFQHGYGIKCIESVVEKYGGNVSISTDDGFFTLNILF